MLAATDLQFRSVRAGNLSLRFNAQQHAVLTLTKYLESFWSILVTPRQDAPLSAAAHPG
jgi:hypothetical protein